MRRDAQCTVSAGSNRIHRLAEFEDDDLTMFSNLPTPEIYTMLNPLGSFLAQSLMTYAFFCSMEQKSSSLR